MIKLILTIVAVFGLTLNAMADQDTAPTDTVPSQTLYRQTLYRQMLHRQ